MRKKSKCILLTIGILIIVGICLSKLIIDYHSNNLTESLHSGLINNKNKYSANKETYYRLKKSPGKIVQITTDNQGSDNDLYYAARIDNSYYGISFKYAGLLQRPKLKSITYISHVNYN
ncbi:hypothetical protein [Lactobacillus sp. ESL0703]|uniref:hypothetical protein n=1 Tax=Lactobacillus sp. ESL0703 TaxID=2983218 RepID=UPI0023F78783|nr:hypothetical protein [Lactobacillus sp. ESL0703]MDF7669356.1 hypothetical protein [Lactobacillus sp. ESL0703]